MHGEDFLVDDGCDWQTVEAVCECLPKLDVITSLALIVEAIDAVYRCAFVIAAKDEEVFWIFDLVG